MMANYFLIIAILSFTFASVSSRIHKLTLTEDERRYIDLTTFGFYIGGILSVKVDDFKLPAGEVKGAYGFTLDRTVNDAISPYLDAHVDSCFLEKALSPGTSPQRPGIVFLKMDLTKMRLDVTCDGDVQPKLYISHHVFEDRAKRHSLLLYRRSLGSISTDEHKRVLVDESSTSGSCSNAILPVTKRTSNGYDYYNTSFAMRIESESEEGLYNLYFHNCPKRDDAPALTFTTEILEKNQDNFLSAGEMPLPSLYSLMSLLFLLSGCFWTYLIRKSRHPVYRIHYVMCVLVYLKAMSLAFHGINYHFIQTKGEHVTAWAILYYLTHLLKGAVLFVTIVLVGTGWNFIKHILADRDKKLFMIVIPLQVVANVAEIIIEESEEGAAQHNAWRDVFILVDLLCCGAILFPVVWSIRHLQDASSTDGKAAINLQKLKLFRHFYIMVVCYIYFTRIIVYLLKITVTFKYSWIDELFRELATYVFFAMTGYKFRPAAANPYFTPTQLDDDPIVLSEIGVLEGVSKLPNRNERRRDDLEPLIIEESQYDSDYEETMFERGRD